VSARIALAGSLNVPAVRTLLLVGVEPFRDRLWDLGYRGLVEDGAYYGFSLALGSAEVTLLEQVDAYRTLAQGGRWSPLRLTLDQPRVAPRAIVSPAAAWIVGDMIADPNARAATFGLDSALRLPFWAAVKTGTSKAMRDNWCIGYSDRFTVGVWVGNAEGDPMRAVSGTSGAAPVWRDVMLALHAREPGRAPPRPADVVASRVARGRNMPGFGNARDVQRMFERAYTNALIRTSASGKGTTPVGDGPVLTMVDCLGACPDVSDRELSQALEELQALAGLEDTPLGRAAIERVEGERPRDSMNPAGAETPQ
jgi:membrane carboxypeptidase/penicillin-binding protein PbpC